MTNVQRLVDTILDEAQAARPGIEYVIWTTPETALLLPRHDNQLRRYVEGRGDGSYRSMVYRDCEVISMPGLEDWLIYVGPLIGDDMPEAQHATRYYGDLRTGEMATTRPTA